MFGVYTQGAYGAFTNTFAYCTSPTFTEIPDRLFYVDNALGTDAEF